MNNSGRLESRDEIWALEEQINLLESEREKALAQLRRMREEQRLTADETCRSPVERGLREIEERPLRLFIEQAPAALAMFDLEMRYVSASRRWRNDYALGARELRGVSHYEVFPEITERWKAIHRRGLAGEVVTAEEDRFERADGSGQWLRWEIRPWRDALGAISGIIIFSEDISSRKQAEEKLRESEEEFRVLSEAMPQMVWTSDQDGRACYFNSRWFDYTGQSYDEAKNVGWLTTLHPEDVPCAQERWTAAVKTGLAYEVEYRIKGKDGCYRWFLSRGVPKRSGGGEIERWIGTCTDISAQKDLEAVLRSRREIAEEANRAKSEFLANMSHEIRTPMTIFMAAVEHLLKMDGDPERLSLLEMADLSAKRLLSLIEDILDFSKIEAGKLEVEEVAFDLRGCVREAVDLLVLPAREKNLRLKTEVALGAPDRIVGDPHRLGQVLVNLVGNAIKFTPAGEVRVSVRPRGDLLEFTVADTGIGIPQEKHPLLFQSFSQVDSSLTRKYGGSGLGLAISKGLVELMGGEISFKSRCGEGSEFTVTIPYAPKE